MHVASEQNLSQAIRKSIIYKNHSLTPKAAIEKVGMHSTAQKSYVYAHCMKRHTANFVEQTLS